ncbi:MAG TPA: PQQ-binding-like beta-propeller repeat protein [Dehalococcoidia bacterium]|jgi:outer membrane protein assembly factor BamB|nr:hypothetical protein [Chloroflexota bacterium]MDP6057089.1 PQQ-binding-like beta-propeller repeat protein [Dehalococcoidia bacterium]MDP7261962.1 PQQ-binding-like beta-propeller repeat protein [Dehalococcoidia bacterium]MDP7485090.1 PQQ-binding-like beta-propeller repeat protein [Dehalococcoidia bacterium]HJP28788.1 PQQ-binding-like beta-propeller repeat protein [Dehalococcoidia bacterium]|tara:strand:+ start:3657 stop:4829 length:1173 start_codon:yes stop_codon:yes gene_type:complete
MIAAVGCVNDLTPEGGWSSPISEGDKIFVGNRDGNLVRFDPASGNLDNSWRYPFDDGLGAMYSEPVVVGDIVYGAGYTCRGNSCDGEVFALNLEDGVSIWRLELKTKLVGPLAIAGSSLLFSTGEIDGEEEDGTAGYLYALDISNGAVNWRMPLDGNAWSGVEVAGIAAYVATMSGTVYAVDTSDNPSFASDSTSRIRWVLDAGAALAGPIHAEAGNIYFGDLANNAYKVNTANRSSTSLASELSAGRGEWKYDAGAWVWAKPLIEDGTIFISALDGSIHALDAASGNQKWTVSIEGQIVSPPTLFDRRRGDTRERALAVPSGEKNVWVISVIDGRELGVFITDEPVKSSPLVHGDNLYVHALNGDLKWFSVDDTSKRGCINLKDGGRCD